MGNKSSTSCNSSNVFVIGENSNDELGLDCKENIERLTMLPSLNDDLNSSHIDIYSATQYTIFSKNNNKNITISGDYNYQFQYFKDKNISIKQIFVRCCFNSSVWITDNNQIYVINDNMVKEPQLISYNLGNKMYDILQIQPGDDECYALCKLSNSSLIIIINYWYNNISNDILNIIISLCHSGGNNVYHFLKSSLSWKLMHCLYHTQIIKIVTSKEPLMTDMGCKDTRCFFLDENGDCYVSGTGNPYKLGIKFQTEKWRSLKFPDIEKAIKFGSSIKDIECGATHALYIDFNGNIYAFGNNRYGQCGQGHNFANDNVYYHDKKPIESLMEYIIIEINCGVYHSHCKTKCNKHFLFGSNSYNECHLTSFKKQEKKPGWQPYCINEIIRKQIGKKTIIKSISLGNYNTKILVTKL